MGHVCIQTINNQKLFWTFRNSLFNKFYLIHLHTTVAHSITALKIFLKNKKLTIGLSFEPCLCSTLSMSTVQSCTNFLESPMFDPCVRYPTPITIIHLLRLATSFLGLELPDKGQLISKGLFCVFKSTKKTNDFSLMGQIEK